MRSLRARLGLSVGAVAGLLVVAAALLVARQQWLRAEALLADDVSAAAEEADRRISLEASSGEGPQVGAAPAGGLVAVLGSDGQLLSSEGATEELSIDAVIELDAFDIGPFELIEGELELDGRLWEASAIGCTEPAACSMIVVAVPRSGFGSFLVPRLGWILGTGIVVALAAGWGTRWIVGRSLRPVERMRRELDEITAENLDRRVRVPGTGDELQDLGESFNHTIDQLAAAVDAQRRFSSDAAHELRSPLAGVRAALEVGLRQPATLEQAASDSLEQLEWTGRLLDDLLLLARREGAPVVLEPRVTDLDDLVLTEVRELELRRPAAGVEHKDVAPVQARVDPSAVRRVVTNLLDNAADHAGGRIRVALGWTDEAHTQWQLSVEDDGPGVPHGHRERVFERFARLDEARNRRSGGSGLGLAIVRELVEQLGGEVSLEDSELGGARFVVRVPAEG